MRDRHQFHLDLTECVLEDRFLPALSPGLAPSPFLPINSMTNQILAPGSVATGGANAGISLIPGPTFFYIRLGVSLNGFGLAGSSIGGTVSIYGLNTRPIAPVAGGGGGGGGVGGGNSTGTGGVHSFSGYGASFSSGYGFALSGLNNFGMASTSGAPSALGSVPVHTYGGGGDLLDNSASNPNGPGNAPPGEQDSNPNAGNTPYPGPVGGVQGPNLNPWNRSPGRNRGGAAPLLNGPGRSNNP